MPPKVNPPRPWPTVLVTVLTSSSRVDCCFDGLIELLKYLVSEAFSSLLPEISLNGGGANGLDKYSFSLTSSREPCADRPRSSTSFDYW
jgi:hypothetical protein